MADIINLRGKKLYPNGSNKYSVTMEILGQPPVSLYGQMAICSTCNGNGKVYATKEASHVIPCPSCHGFGVLIRFLRDDQLEA